MGMIPDYDDVPFPSEVLYQGNDEWSFKIKYQNKRTERIELCRQKARNVLNVVIYRRSAHRGG